MWIKLKNLFSKPKARLKPQLEAAAVFEEFKKQVSFGQPIKFINKQGLLIVRADHGIAAQEIQYQSQRLAAKINRQIGEKKVKQIRVIQ